jgi:Flp pilus assembly protein TadG
MNTSPTSPDKPGQSLVEFAIILTVILLLILGSIDLGRGIYAFSVIQNAAREGARYGSVNPNQSGIIAAARRLAHGLDTSMMTVHPPNFIDIDSDSDYDLVQVNVTYTFSPVTPMLAQLLGGGSGITLTSSSQMVLE